MILHALVFVSLFTLQAATPPEVKLPPVPAGSSGIYGRVIRPDNTPIDSVTVEIRLMGTPGARSDTVTDADGRYGFESIAAGRYFVSPKLEQHVVVSSIAFGVDKIPGATIVLDNRDVTTKPGARQAVNFTMQRGATIAGRVGNEAGAPFPDVSVAATHIDTVVASRSTQTNARGEFELLVPPGDYFVRAIAPRVASGADYVGYVATFYPGVANQKEAAAIRVSPGDVARGVDFSLHIDGSHSLRGHVSATSGEFVGGVRVTLTTSPGNSTRTATTKPDGAFAFSRVKPGRYMLSARQVGSTGSEAAWQLITITQAVHEIDLRLEPTATIRGRIVGENGERVDTEGARVGAALSDDAVDVDPLLPAQTEVSDDGSFVIDGVFGPRMFRVLGLPANWRVRSVLVGGNEVTVPHLTVQPGAIIADVVIVITRND
jgi:hypothetical protein